MKRLEQSLEISENMTRKKEAEAAVSAKSGVISEFYSSPGRGKTQDIGKKKFASSSRQENK